MSLRTWRPQGPHDPSSCATFTVKLPEAGLLQEKEVLHLCKTGLLQSRPALCDPVDCGWPGISVSGVLQARIPEWVAVPFCFCFLMASVLSDSV